MIPSAWWRQAMLLVVFWSIAIGLLWAAYLIHPDDPGGLGITIVGVLLLFAIHACAPLSAKILARSSSDMRLQKRLTSLAQASGVVRPIILYEHAEISASAVGVLAGHARIYMTTTMLTRMSDEGIRGMIAHEETHIREHHALLICGFAAGYMLLAQLVGHNRYFVVAFLAYLALRRYLEYRADAGAARRIGKSEMLVGLQELARCCPPNRWGRWMIFANSYPPLQMRIEALEAGVIRIF